MRMRSDERWPRLSATLSKKNRATTSIKVGQWMCTRDRPTSRKKCWTVVRARQVDARSGALVSGFANRPHALGRTMNDVETATIPGRLRQLGILEIDDGVVASEMGTTVGQSR